MVLTSIPCVQVLSRVGDGPEAWFSHVWASRLLSFDSSEHQIRISGPSDTHLTSFNDALRQSQAGNTEDISPKSLIVDYLKGHGVPCPSLFDEVKHTFSTLVDLEQVDLPAFRVRMFAWAATGAPMVELNDDIKARL